MNQGARPACRPRRRWSEQEDALLLSALEGFPDGNYSWRAIAGQIPGRTTKDCRKRWVSGLNDSLRKGCWSAEEDETLRRSVNEIGTDWAQVSCRLSGSRSGDQCAKRWREVLDPSIKREAWTQEEDESLLDVYYEMGTSWNKIATRFEGRTALGCRNRACKLLVSQNKPKPGTKEAEDARSAILAGRKEASHQLAEASSMVDARSGVHPEADVGVVSIDDGGSVPFSTVQQSQQSCLYPRADEEEIDVFEGSVQPLVHCEGTQSRDNPSTSGEPSLLSSPTSLSSLTSPFLTDSYCLPDNLFWSIPPPLDLSDGVSGSSAFELLSDSGFSFSDLFAQTCQEATETVTDEVQPVQDSNMASVALQSIEARAPSIAGELNGDTIDCMDLDELNPTASALPIASVAENMAASPPTRRRASSSSLGRQQGSLAYNAELRLPYPQRYSPMRPHARRSTTSLSGSGSHSEQMQDIRALMSMASDPAHVMRCLSQSERDNSTYRESGSGSGDSSLDSIARTGRNVATADSWTQMRGTQAEYSVTGTTSTSLIADCLTPSSSLVSSLKDTPPSSTSNQMIAITMSMVALKVAKAAAAMAQGEEDASPQDLHGATPTAAFLELLKLLRP